MGDVDEAMGRGRRNALLLFLGFLCLYGILAALGDFHGTEARRAVISREMLTNGNFVLPTLGGEVTLTKPPLTYQLQAIAMAVFGETVFAARFPTALLTAVLVAAAYLAGLSFGRPRLGSRYALAAALLIGLHPVWASYAFSAEIDGGFSAWVGLSLLALLRACAGGRQTLWVLLAGLAAGCAFASKGPPALLTLLPALVLCVRRLRVPRLLLYLLCAALPLLLWIAALSLHYSIEELFRVTAEESVGRTGFYEWKDFWEIPGDLLALFAALLPLLLLAFVRRREQRMERAALSDERRHASRVLLFSGLAGICLLAFFPHRPTRYALPAFFPLLFWLVHYADAYLERPLKAYERVRRYLSAALFLLFAIWLVYPWCMAAVFSVQGHGVPAELPALFPAWLNAAPYGMLLLAVLARRKGTLPLFLGLGVLGILIVGVDLPERRRRDPSYLRPFATEVAQRTGKERVTLWRHVPAQFLWALRERAINHEFPAPGAKPESPWLLIELPFERDASRLPSGYVQDRAYRARHVDIVLAKREGH